MAPVIVMARASAMRRTVAGHGVHLVVARIERREMRDGRPRISLRSIRATTVRRSGQIERLLEAHRVKFRLAAGPERSALDLIEPLLVIEHRDVGVAAARLGEAELTAAVDRADAVRDFELDHT